MDQDFVGSSPKEEELTTEAQRAQRRTKFQIQNPKLKDAASGLVLVIWDLEFESTLCPLCLSLVRSPLPLLLPRDIDQGGVAACVRGGGNGSAERIGAA